MRPKVLKYLTVFFALLLGGGGVSLAQMMYSGAFMGAAMAGRMLKERADSLILKGYVFESATGRPLFEAYAVPIDSAGEAGDTLRIRPDFDPVVMTDQRKGLCFSMQTVRKDSTYVFEVGCKGYTPQTVVYRVENLKKREMTRRMPEIVLEREPYRLNEVEVVASKVKFYHNGDTLVYNADAFMLADGAMLQDLVRQLPGVELKEDGRILINGEYVESLLLNGKDFFSSDRKLMLENLGAYTVDKVQVYRGQNLIERWENNPNAQKHLTMDVKLKKEYSIGVMTNALAGYGTDGRYLAKLFATSFGRSMSVALLGNINNISDNTSMNQYDAGSTGMSSSTPGTYRNLALNYNYNPDFKRSLRGEASVHTRRSSRVSSVNRTNFLNGGDTYEYSHSADRDKSFDLSTDHHGMMTVGNANLSGNLQASLSHNTDSGRSVSASFNDEQADTSIDDLEAIYGDGSRESLEALINRSISRNDSRGTRAKVSGRVDSRLKMPSLSDILTLSLTAGYSTGKTHRWNDYIINYGDDPEPSDSRRQFTDSPNHDLNLGGALSYLAIFENLSLTASYRTSYHDRTSDSYLYSLHLLDELTSYGELPDNYADAYDPYQSYTSTDNEFKNTLQVNIEFQKRFSNGKMLSLMMDPSVAVVRRSMDYLRNNKTYNVGHTTLVPSLTMCQLRFGSSRGFVSPGEKKGSYQLVYRYGLNMNLPQLMSLVDVVDDRNPLYIEEGNPHLKNQLSQRHDLSWTLSPGGGKFSNELSGSYSYSTDDIVRGQMYDMNTGVRRVRYYNVNGNYDYMLSEQVRGSFSVKRHNFTWSTGLNFSKSHSLTMISTDGSEPEKSGVNNLNYSGSVNLFWDYAGKVGVSSFLRADKQNTTSASENVSDIRAFNLSWNLTGNFILPLGFGIETWLICHARSGYGSKELNRTDVMWNAAATYTPPRSAWTIRIQGYDLLHQQSNINYAVSATGKTVIVTNTIPRYILATVMYRFNLHPKSGLR